METLELFKEVIIELTTNKYIVAGILALGLLNLCELIISYFLLFYQISFNRALNGNISEGSVIKFANKSHITNIWEGFKFSRKPDKFVFLAILLIQLMPLGIYIIETFNYHSLNMKTSDTLLAWMVIVILFAEYYYIKYFVERHNKNLDDTNTKLVDEHYRRIKNNLLKKKEEV